MMRMKTQVLKVMGNLLISLVASMVIITGATATEILITVKHDSRKEAAVFNGFSRNSLGAQSYQSTFKAKAVMASLASEYQLEPVNISWQIHSLNVYCAVFRLTGSDSANDVWIEEFIERLSADSRVDSVQLMESYSTTYDSTTNNKNESYAQLPDKQPPVESSKYNDTYFERQYGKHRQSVETLHTKSTGKNVRIALIDTGADISHADFRGAKLIKNNSSFQGNDAFDTDRHGTATLGVIAAVPDNNLGIVGLAPDAQVDVIKACWHQPNSANPFGAASCNSLTISIALDFAIQNEVDIINMSLAGPKDPLVARLVARAIDEEIMLIASDPVEGKLRYPAMLPGVLAVSSMDEQEPHALSQNEQMSGDGTINLIARDVISTAPGGVFDFFSGSSMSAAIVTGIAAHSFERLPEGATSEQRISFIQSQLQDLGLRL